MTRRAKFTVWVEYDGEEIPNAERLENDISHEMFNIDGIHAWEFTEASDEEVDDGEGGD